MARWKIARRTLENNINAAGLSMAISFCCVHAVSSLVHLWRTQTGILKYFCFSCVFSFEEVLAAKGKFIFRCQIPFFRGCIALGPFVCLYAYVLHAYENHTQILVVRPLTSVAYLDLFSWPVLYLPSLHNYTIIKLFKHSRIFLCFNSIDLLWTNNKSLFNWSS